MSELSIDKINNPFTNISNISITDEYTDKIVMITKSNITKYYKEIYILCPMSNTESINTSEFFMTSLDKKKFTEYTKHMILYKTTSKLAKNPVHFINLIKVDTDLIDHCNYFNYELNSMGINLYWDKPNETDINEYIISYNSLFHQ